MLRRESRRPWRLVRLRAPSSCLNVLTGTRHGGTSRAGGRGRAHARAGALGAASVETLRQTASSLVGGLFAVLTGDETRPGSGMRRGGRGRR